MRGLISLKTFYNEAHFFSEISMNVDSCEDNFVSSAFHPSGVGKSSTSLHRLGLMWGAFACVGRQVKNLFGL